MDSNKKDYITVMREITEQQIKDEKAFFKSIVLVNVIMMVVIVLVIFLVWRIEVEVNCSITEYLIKKYYLKEI